MDQVSGLFDVLKAVSKRKHPLPNGDISAGHSVDNEDMVEEEELDEIDMNI